MKKSLFWMLSALAVSGLFTFAACDEDESQDIPACQEGNNPCGKDAYAGYPYCHVVNNAPVCSLLESCPAGSQMGADGRCGGDVQVGHAGDPCSDDDSCDGDLKCISNVCAYPTSADYLYVRIEDKSEKCTVDNAKGNCGEDPGADIDAVALVKAGKAPTYAKKVVGYHRADGARDDNADNEIAANPARAVGAPDSFIHYPSKDDDVCYYWKENTHPSDNNAERTYVSLGGEGGWIILQMEEKIEAGDKIDVLELGDCTLWNTTDAKGKKYQKAKGAEKIEVQVSVTESESGDWKLIGSGSATSGIITVDTTGKI